MAISVASGTSSDPDPFRAGQEAVRKAQEKGSVPKPNLTLVFSSVRYADEKLLKGIRSMTGETPLVGCTDAGGITQDGPNRRAVTVMLLQSDDMEFVIGLGKGLGDD